MKRNYLLTIGAILSLFSCDSAFHSTPSGLQYRIIAGDQTGPVAESGSTIKLHYQQTLHDTATVSTYGNMPAYKALIPGTIFAYDPFEVLGYGIRAGDSLVVRARMDSLLSKERLSKLPPNVQPEDELITTIKVLKVFPFQIQTNGNPDSALQEDIAAEQARMDSIQEILGPKRVISFLKKNNIQAVQIAEGVFIEVLKNGNGPRIESGNTIRIKYRVTTLAGKRIDSNMDSSFQRNENKKPLEFKVGSPYMLEAVDKAIPGLKEGASVRIYLPVMKTRRKEQSYPPGEYTDLVFEIHIEKILQ